MLILGGGNAALCAAISARRAGASVLLLESAPEHFRGGNSRHTRNLRYLHESGNEILSGPYAEEEFWEDLISVTGGETNEKLARLLIRGSTDLGHWMTEQGVRFQGPLRGTLNLSRTNAFFLGGGKALVNAYFKTAIDLGVEVAYNSEVQGLDAREGEFKAAIVMREGATHEIPAKSVVAASGGFQANIAWLKEYWGDAADNFLVRGSPFDTGLVLRALLDCGAVSVGDPRQCHAVAIDARAPKFDGGIVTRLDCIPFGIVVNKLGLRFYDEGEDFWPRRYAIWGRLVAQQPEQIAYSIIDSRSKDLFMPSVFPAIEADSLTEMASRLELDPAVLETTVAAFNSAVRPGVFDSSTLDDCATEGLEPPKSHWARRLEEAPFYAYPLRPGITFTYLGVGVDERARVLMKTDTPAANIFAAGEIMAGNILGKGYLAGLGMTIGTVFGRIAGGEAARHALS